MQQIVLLSGLMTATLLAGGWLCRTLGALHARRADAGGAAVDPAGARTMFLFEGPQLVDATPGAHALLDALPAGEAWPRLLGYLARRFPQAGADLESLPRDRSRVYLGTDAAGCGQLRLTAERVGDRLRLTILAGDAPEAGTSCGPSPAQQAALDELTLLRQSLEQTPALAWREDESGAVIWANSAYRALAAEDVEPDAQPWPLPALFAPRDTAKPAGRVRLGAEGPAAHWFDFQDYPAGADTLRFALPADDIVRAQSALRDFVQTLSKTFADLPVGLAVFDRQRRLQMFNPALGDLTTLSPSFLTARPSLEDFLDRLREARMMPEPRDYRGWRQQMIALETAAASGYHSETWTLPGGQTYRVIGRPHPDGAVAFLFEDISAGMSLTRKFRAEIDLGHELLDALPDALCVIGPDGDVLATNAPYRRLWPGADQALAPAIGQWSEGQRDAPIWDALDCALMDRQAAQDFAPAPLSHPEAGLLDCRVTPLSAGRNMIRFTPTGAAPPATAPDAASDLPLSANARAAREMAALSRRGAGPGEAPEPTASAPVSGSGGKPARRRDLHVV